MAKEKLFSNKRDAKSAKIVGQVLALHPHGDSSVYGALVRLAQDFSLPIPIIHGTGNFGNEEMPAAAMRYTSAKLSKFGDVFVQNLDSNIIPFITSDDGTEEEPQYLNVPFPTILAYPTLGLGMGMATSIPPFNISDIIDVTKNYIKTQQIDFSNFYPDFPSGCSIVNKNALLDIYNKGSGSLQLRAIFNSSGNIITINNLPIYSVAAKIEAQIIEEKTNGNFREVIKVVNTTAEKQELTLQLRSGANHRTIIEQLCRLTDAQRNFTFSLKALDENHKPRHFSLEGLLKKWVEHHKTLVEKELELKLQNLNKQKELNEGLLKALIDIDTIIELIKSSNNRAEALANLIKKGFTEYQASNILSIRLVKLTKIESVEIEKKVALIKTQIDETTALLEIEDLFNNFLINQMSNYKKLAIPRRSIVENAVLPKLEKVKNENFFLNISKNTASISTDAVGKYIAFTPSNPLHLLVDNTTIPIRNDSIPVYNNAWGVVNTENRVVHISRDGYIKATEGSEFMTSRQAKATNQDEVVQVLILSSEDLSKNILLTAANGKQAQFKVADVPITKRGAKGVRAIKPDSNTDILKGEIINIFKPNVTVGRNKKI